MEKFKKNTRQLLIYLIVGAGATLVEWVMFYLLNQKSSLHYMIATTIAFIVSTFANWFLGRILLFHNVTVGFLKEIVGIYATSILGLLMNLLIMWIAIERCGIHEMIAKILATGIVFFWNFLIRKFLIYKV